MKIGFIGAGNMGTAYISALSEKKENDIYFFELSEKQKEYIEVEFNAKSLGSIEEVIENSELIVLAIKPNVLLNVLDVIKEMKNEIESKNKIVLSIAAGVKIETIEDKLCKNIKIVRVMPNTPSLIRKGVSGVTFNSKINDDEKLKVIEILQNTGDVFEVNEEHLEILTAISGSGPAFVFLLINSMAEGGVKLGMKKDLAIKLAAKTFEGAAALLSSMDKHPEELKDMVTSPGGTTASGLFNMEKNSIRKIMIETVEETYKRAKEIGKKG